MVLAAAPETNSAYSTFEIFVRPSARTPLHAHSNEEEVFYGVRGKLRFQAGDAIDENGPGSLVHAAKNVPHLFANTGNKGAVLIVIARPGVSRVLRGGRDRDWCDGRTGCSYAARNRKDLCR